MISIEHMHTILKTLPDPAFILSRSGKYIAIYGGRDNRYYHDSAALIGTKISDVVKKEKADWFLEKINLALDTKQLIIETYALRGTDIKGLPLNGPTSTIWFEGRIQALDFQIEGEEVVLWVASNISKRHELEEQLRQQSDTDQLTGFFNRRRLERDLKHHHDTMLRYDTPISLLIFDLDNLKQINDTLGHHAGDKAILAIADTCRKQLRSTDTAYRFGGDEFVVALPNTTLEEATHFATRMRECFYHEQRKLSLTGLYATASIGVSTMLMVDHSYEDALKRADHALYKAKQNGKNKVAVHAKLFNKLIEP
ncbi:GGDEF domain-containing protein [Sulfurospirillum sp. 1612]|uniref:GGDEF domain-containing protein n=1 Tax=Sulfurospirillum sp. 1612 TaxID=3094835 RepID=UPI002F943DDA